MGIKRAELQSLVTQARQFLNAANKFLDGRNTSLNMRAVDDSLYINYAVGQVILRNIQESAECLVRDASRLGLSSVESYIPSLKLQIIDKPYWAFQRWLNGGMDAAWQNQARNSSQDLRQTLLCAQEWLDLESYNIHMAAEAVPVPTHLKFDQELQMIQKNLQDVMSSEAYRSITGKLTPMSQRESWFSEEMRMGTHFLRLRVDWRLLQDYRNKILSRKTPAEKEKFADVDVVKVGQDDLIVLANMLNKRHPKESDMTNYLFDGNKAMRKYLPQAGMQGSLKAFSEAQKSGEQLTAENLEDITAMKDMPRPEDFGKERHKVK